MNQKKWWIGIAGGGVLCAAGLGTMIWLQHGKIEGARAEISTLRAGIDTSRKTIEGTAALEREVIVLREISEVMKQILPDTDDINNLVRTLQHIAEESHVRISALKKRAADSQKGKGDFDKVAYTLSLEGDAFQLLDFLDLIESHGRFMCVPNFRITATQRTQLEKEGVPAHKVTLDVETYVYEPRKDSKQVKIESYDRKKDLLLGEINRRRQALTVSNYTYRGQRGRRDPWIDPRVPVLGDNQSPYTVQEQMDVVQKLAERTEAVKLQWEQIKGAENVIKQMLMRADFDAALAAIEEDVRRLQTEKSISYVPSSRRLQSEISDALTLLRNELTSSGAVAGPSENQLKEIEKTMATHMEKAEYKLILEAYRAVEKDLALAEADALRKPMVERIREFNGEALTILDFQKIEMKLDGLAIVDGRAFAVINGKTVGIGDLLDKDLIVRAIIREEIEFIYRGIVFARRF